MGLLIDKMLSSEKRVTKVRKSGVEAEKNEIRMDSSSLLVRSTRKTSSGITKKL